MPGASASSDFTVLLDFVSSPMVLADADGSVVAANATARETLGGLQVGRVLPVPDSARADLDNYLGRCLSTFAIVPGALVLRSVDGPVERHACRGTRTELRSFGARALVLMQIDGVAFDRRFKALASKLHDARKVIRERRLRARQTQILMQERECLLERLESDAAARAAAERERDEVLGRLYRTGQDERRRLARDLHDHAGQHLMALDFGLRRLEPHLTTPAARDELGRLLGQAQDIGQALRRVILTLRPAALDEFGFVTALRYLVEEWSRVAGIPAEFQVGSVEVPLPPDHAITLYRLTQEALTNVAKHAGEPNCVSVVLVFGPADLTLSIDDDGTGFDADDVSVRALVSQGKLGLVGMRERISLVGGILDIDSTPGLGTSVTARVHLGRNDPGHV